MKTEDTISHLIDGSNYISTHTHTHTHINKALMYHIPGSFWLVLFLKSFSIILIFQIVEISWCPAAAGFRIYFSKLVEPAIFKNLTIWKFPSTVVRKIFDNKNIL